MLRRLNSYRPALTRPFAIAVMLVLAAPAILPAHARLVGGPPRAGKPPQAPPARAARLGPLAPAGAYDLPRPTGRLASVRAAGRCGRVLAGPTA